MSRSEVVAWEERWSKPAGLASLGSVVFVVAAIVVATQLVGSSSGESELLRNVQDHRGGELLSSILQAIGIALLAVPLYYLFRAAKNRSERMRGQLVGVVIAAPLFLAVLAVLTGVTTLHAASSFVSSEVPHLVAKGVSLNSDRADEAAKEAIDDAPLRNLAAGFGIAGQLGFVVAMIYTCLYAMRVGLLTRFWGSMGIALGAVSFLFFQFTLLWFVYLGILLLFMPSAKPPAWASGKAEPWPSPGEKAAQAMESPAEIPEPPQAPDPEEAPSGNAPSPPSSSESESR